MQLGGFFNTLGGLYAPLPENWLTKKQLVSGSKN